ncbi:hypothetical protein BMS3Abin11_01484 [bacterium BMS3Abin11]|nr:hypothetical protein BMS3Abin11_01484 [bacterium BMS3Abin11]
MRIIQVTKTRRRPDEGMNAVGHGAHTVARVHLPRGLGMALGHAIDILTQVERQTRHIEIVRPGQLPQCRRIEEFPENMIDQII